MRRMPRHSAGSIPSRRAASRVAASALTLLLAAACEPEPTSGGQIGGERVDAQGCAVEETELELEEASPLGFSGADVLGELAGDYASTLAWAKGGSVPIELSVVHEGGKVRFLARSVPESPPDGGPAPVTAEECPSVLELGMVLGIRTEDGAFDESVPATLFATAAASGKLHASMDPASLRGSYEVTEIDASQYDRFTLLVDATLDGESAHGSITGQAEQVVESPDPEVPVSATSFQVGTF